MTPGVAASALNGIAQPEPPAPPVSIEETGLHRDVLAQLLLKHLVSGEQIGRASCRERV